MTNSTAVPNPTGGADGRRCAMQPALHDNLMQAVLAPENMQRAWKQVKSNKGAPGIDRISLQDFPAHATVHWPGIRQALIDGSYCPQPVRQVIIAKPGGGERMLGIPTVMDRMIQQAIAQVLTPIFDPDFSASSFGFRPRRSAHMAVRQVQAHIEAGHRIAVDLDLAKFFDNVPHDILMACIAKRIGDKRLLALIGSYLRAGIMVGEHYQPSEIGSPQGGPISPLLSNILLDELDRELEKRGHRFVRYADDLLVLVKSERAGHRVKASLTKYLDRKLRLPVNEAKSQVAKIDACTFLGFTFRRNKLRWSDRAFADFKHQVRKLTGRSWGCSGGFRRYVAFPRNGTGLQASVRPARVSMAYRLTKLAQYVRGWMGYFGISQYYRPIPELDEWLRRRVRMCYWKQWRLCRTKIANLLKLGVGLRSAIITGVSSKSYWHLARTPATQQGMSNAWLKAQGLISIRDQWMKAQGYS